jgi:hypothetical protein
MSTDDPKITKSEHVTPEDLTPDLLEVDSGPRGPTSQRVAQEVSRATMVKFLAELDLIHERFREDLRIPTMFPKLAKHASELIENARWWDEVNERWVDVDWEVDLDHVRFAIIEKYDLVFDKCAELDELFQELGNLHTILEKIAEPKR